MLGGGEPHRLRPCSETQTPSLPLIGSAISSSLTRTAGKPPWSSPEEQVEGEVPGVVSARANLAHLDDSRQDTVCNESRARSCAIASETCTTHRIVSRWGEAGRSDVRKAPGENAARCLAIKSRQREKPTATDKKRSRPGEPICL